MIKNLRYLLMALVVFAFSSCEKEEIGSTNTVAVAGEWMVQVDVVDASGDVAYEDPYGLGYVPMLTYNTNADNGKEMYVSDIGNFWLFTVKVPCDVNARTFGSSTPAPNEAYDERGNLYDIDVTVDKGKIIEKVPCHPPGVLSILLNSMSHSATTKTFHPATAIMCTVTVAPVSTAVLNKLHQINMYI